MWDVQRAAVAAVIGGLALVAAPAVVSAEPFTRAELDEALRLRVDAGHVVTVAAGADEGAIVVTVDGRSRTVELDGERGAEAARVVALVAAALAVEGGVAPRDDDEALGAEVMMQPAVRAVRPGRWGLGMTIDQPYGDRGVAGAGVVAVFERGGWLRWSAALGFDRRATEVMTFGGERVSMTAVTARAGVTLPIDGGGRTAVTASVLAAPFLTRGGIGHEGVLVGAGVGARFAVPLPSASTDLLVQTGVDVMATRVEYRWEGAPLLDTGWARPYLLVGVSWEGGP